MFEILTNQNHSIRANTISFPSGERHIQLIDDEQMVWDKALEQTSSVSIKATIRSSDDILDYLLLENALLSQKSDLAIDLLMPYLPYARQDRVCAPGQAFSLQVMAQLLRIHPKRSLTVWDCHSSVGLTLTGAHNISAAQLIANSPELVHLIQAENSILVCPDKGAIDRTQAVADYFSQSQIVYAQKIRNPVTGQITHSEVDADDLTRHTAIIVDDICDGGATFTHLAKALREKGCQRIVLYVTHGVFSRGLSVFDGLIDEIFTTTSLPQTAHPKLNVIHIQTINAE